MIIPVPGLQLAEGQDAYQLLAAPWNELWLGWLDEGNSAYKQQAQDSHQQRMTFVQAVVADALKKSNSAVQNGDAAVGAEAESAAAPQQEQQVTYSAC